MADSATNLITGWVSIGLKWFQNLPIQRKQLLGLFTSEVISIVGLVGVGAGLIVAGGRSLLVNQAKSELAVAEINYNIKINQMGFGFRGQSDNAAIIAAARKHDVGRPLGAKLQAQAKQILQNEIEAPRNRIRHLSGTRFTHYCQCQCRSRGRALQPKQFSERGTVQSPAN